VPSYELSREERDLANQILSKFDEAADLLTPGNPERDERIAELRAAPNPVAALRRVPQV
jgi:hypothetical protein